METASVNISVLEMSNTNFELRSFGATSGSAVLYSAGSKNTRSKTLKM